MNGWRATDIKIINSTNAAFRKHKVTDTNCRKINTKTIEQN